MVLCHVLAGLVRVHIHILHRTLNRALAGRPGGTQRDSSLLGEGWHMGLGLGKVDQGISPVDVVTDKS